MRIALTLLTFAALTVLSGPANAFHLEEAFKGQQVADHGHNGHDRGETDLRIAQRGGMSLSQAIELVRRRTGGKVIGAETRIRGGREVHHIKVLKDGKVSMHTVNGASR